MRICKFMSIYKYDEPHLKPLTGEIYHYSTSNITADARVDILAQGFWVCGQLAFSHIRVFNPLAKYYNAKHIYQSLQYTRKRKKEATTRESLRQKICFFTPLVFARTGGMSREYGKCYSCLTELLAIKKNLNKSTVMGWLRAKLPFKLLPSANIYIRGSRARNVNEMKENKRSCGALSLCE